MNLATISDLCDIVKGKTGIMKAIPGQYPLVVTGAERKSASTFQFDEEAVCIPLVSSTGHGHKSLNYVHYQSGKFALGTILAAVIPKDKNVLSAEFLQRYLQFNKDRILVPLMTGAANVTLSVKNIAKVVFPLPSLEEQHVYVNLINRIEKQQVNLNHEFTTQSSYLTQLRQAILQEAIEGKLTADWRKGDPDYNAGALLEKIKAEKEKLVTEGKIKKQKPLAPIKPEEVPFELPEGWVWCKIDSLVYSLKSDIRTGPFGSALHKHDHKTIGYPVWGIESIGKDGTFQYKNKIYVDDTKAIELKSFKVTHGDIIISRSGTVGELCLIPEDAPAGFISTNLLKISLNKEVILPEYFTFLFKGTKSINDQLDELCFGTTRIFITQTILSKLMFPLPSKEEQLVIVNHIKKNLSKVDELEMQVSERKEQSEQLMQAVLREAFEGKS